MAEVVILGAGLTGISAAYHLEQQQFSDYKIFEKEKNSGGLCRTVNQDGFTFDYTGHLLHISDPYFKSLISKYVGFEHFNTIFRKSFVYSQDVYTRYPYQVNLFGLPVETIAACIEGFVKRPQKKSMPKSFKSWVLQNFGSGFGKYFFFPYQEKIFSYDIHKLSASWTGRFVPQTSLPELIQGATQDYSDAQIGYNSTFFYPKSGGIQFWVDKFAQAVAQPIHTEFCVKSIDIKNKIITFTNGAQESYKKLITTIPLDTLLALIIEPTDLTIKQARHKLLCNSVINFNLGINRPDLSDKHWIYYPEEKYPFYRIGFPHNFTEQAVPTGCSSLYGEFSYINNTPEEINNKLQYALSATRNLLFIDQKDILVEKIIDIKHAYVIYNNWRDKHLPLLLNTLATYDIYSVGRYGAWKYASMQEAILDGKEVVETIFASPVAIVEANFEYNQKRV
jgi:protoporphyrinogen oxidase